VKVKTLWNCAECGQESKKWLGQCPSCQNWNTFHEEILQEEGKFSQVKGALRAKPFRLSEVEERETPRSSTGVEEIDRLFGGGVVPGSFVLVGGEPGIGKSTLMLQLAKVFCKQEKAILYVTAEESVEQTAMRAKRLGISSDTLYLLNEGNFSEILRAVDELKPDFLIIDSIQVIYKPEVPSSPGSVTQVRECASELMHLAKGRTLTTFVIGHVTKGGEIAGPKILEHLVDTVLYFEGDKSLNLRLVRVVKNRFGPTDEIAVFQMMKTGLAEVPNPSKLFLEERSNKVAGSLVSCTLEGSRSVLLEVQALVAESGFSNPARKGGGIDVNRLSLLLAVLEKKLQIPLYRYDVFVSVAGGFRVKETGIDLAVLLAVVSSLKNKVIDSHLLCIGEVGLAGEVRGISRPLSRIKEAKQLGFKRCILPKKCMKTVQRESDIDLELYGVEHVEEAIDIIL